jgi:hypothetical protein
MRIDRIRLKAPHRRPILPLSAIIVDGKESYFRWLTGLIPG